MEEVTDPATELTDLCDRLSQDVNMRGDDYLAKEFGVKKDSREFYRLLAIILDRIAVLEAIVSELPIKAADRDEATNDLIQIAGAFSVAHLAANWKAPNGPHHLRRENTRFLRGLSSQVGHVETYPLLTEDEIDEFLSKARELEAHLLSVQAHEPDFIRKAILTGVAEFIFCVERLRWVGWAHTFNSIEKLFHAYMVLERRMPEDSAADSAQTTLRILKSLLDKVVKTAERGKSYWDLGRFYLDAIGVYHLTQQPTIQLLTGP